ncbi:AraC family transcriptional regulator [Chitinophagaceae bacterium LWZ2-11]
MASSIKKYSFKPGFPIEIEMLSLPPQLIKDPCTLTKPHRTEFYHILWVKEGAPTHIIDFKPVKLQPGSLLFINKDKVHMFDKPTKYKGSMLLFTDSFFCKTEADKKFLRSTILFNNLLDITAILLPKTQNILVDTFKQIESELLHPVDTFKHDVLQNLVHNLLLLADREKRMKGFVEIKKGADLDHTLSFKDLLDDHFKTLKSVNGYAQKLHVSEKRLNQATSKVLGKTPKELIDERVLLEAKRLLSHSSESIKEISFDLGFEEPTNFIKYFKKHVTQTPVEFREYYNNK